MKRMKAHRYIGIQVHRYTERRETEILKEFRQKQIL